MSSIAIEYKEIENKLLIMYLINMMELPMSRPQITEFIIEKELMSYFTLEQNLTEMVERGFLEATRENAQDISTTRYSLTENGITNLDLLEKHIPRPARQIISTYVEDNRGRIIKSYEKTANYFPNPDNDGFTVKLGVYDDKRSALLMEISVAVATREQAKQIQAGWNANYSTLYQNVLEVLTEPPKTEQESSA